jgi:cell fate regulator YaaT (PSP1 superfamily)
MNGDDDDIPYEYEDILPDEDVCNTETADAEVAILEGKTLPPATPVYQLCISCSNETVYAVYNGGESMPENADELKPGTRVLVPTRYGMDLARVSGKICGRMRQNLSRVSRIERIASELDLEREKSNKSKEAEAFKICKQKIAERGLDMKLISVHFLLEEPKILFFFTAESRVDFRELLKDLVYLFKLRIELRQVGIRDEARMTGGLGTCSRPFCCHSISDKLKPVAIRMAKEQGLSLNSMKISGPCGRLLCCLAYEHGFYTEQRRCMPAEGSRIVSDGISWKITEVNLLRGKITLVAEDGRQLRLSKDKFEKVDNHWTIKK